MMSAAPKTSSRSGRTCAPRALNRHLDSRRRCRRRLYDTWRPAFRRPEYRGYQCHASLARVALSGYSNDHGCSPIKRIRLRNAVWAPSNRSSQPSNSARAGRPSIHIEHLISSDVRSHGSSRSPSLSSKCPCWNGRLGFPMEPARFSFNEHKCHIIRRCWLPYQTVLASLPPQLTGGSMDNDWLNP